MASVTVIVPVYNTAPYLRKSLDSLLSQTHEDFQAICIDDGSIDDGLDILREYESRDSRISVLTKKNGGVSDTRNLGLSLARGEYVYFFDPDDWLESNLLCDNVEIAQRLGSDVVLFGSREIDVEGRILASHVPPVSKHYPDRKVISASLPEIVRQNRLNPVWNKLYRYSSLAQSGALFPAQRVGEDALFNYRAFSSFSSISTNSKIYYNYLSARPVSATSTRILEIFDDNRMLISEMAELFASFGSDNRGVVNEGIVNHAFLGHLHAAKAAIGNGGYSRYIETIRTQGIAEILKCMDGHGLPRARHKVKRVCVHFPAFIYAYVRFKSLSHEA